MCDICDGMTYEQSWLRIHDLVTSGDWAVQGVESAGHQRPWAYTVGLIEHFGHPELVITDGDLAASGVILNTIGEWICDGDRFDVGSVVDDDDGFRIAFGPVHPTHLRHGLCAAWASYYEWVGAAPGPLEVLEVTTASPWACEHVRACRGDLAAPGAFAVSGGTNRAERRRIARRRR